MRFSPGGCYLICGRTGTGKTHLLKYVVGSMKSQFAIAFGFCATRFAGNLDFIPQERCFEAFSVKKVQDILKHQAAAVAQGTAGNVLLVFDDVLGEETIKLYGSLFLQLATTCRHYCITVIITTQYLHKVPPAMRENSRYVFVTSVDNPRTMKMLYEEFGINGITRKEFDHFCEQFTKGYSAFLINRGGKTKGETFLRIEAPPAMPGFTL